MTNVLIGGIPGFYIYWGRNATFKSGDPSSDKHQPFNPITESTGIKVPQEIYDLLPCASDLYPLLEVDKSLEPSTVTFKTHYREPFLLLAAFTHKELPSNWSGGSDTITANFSDRSNVDNDIWFQIRIPDPSGSGNHVDLLFDGGKIVEYKWIGEAQSSVKEEVSIKFAEISENTQAIDVDNGFDDGSFDSTALSLDGGWAYWDSNLYSSTNKVLLTKDVTVEVGGSAPAGLKIQSWTLTIPVPIAMEFVASSRVAGIVYEEVRGPWLLEIDGKLVDNSDISEAISALSSKTKATVQLEYDESPFSKYIQFTNGVLKMIDGLSIPAAGQAIDVTYIYEGAGSSVLSYSWTGSESDDPSNHIKHTDV